MVSERGSGAPRSALTRTFATVLVLALVSAGCARSEFTRPPDPEFVRGERANPTTPNDDVAGGLSEPDPILPEDIESSEPAPDGGDVNQMVLTDDAGNTINNAEGWAAFDAALAGRLVPADSAAAVAVMVNGEIVHQGAYGTRVPGTDEPTEIGDRFRIASISKTITAIVAMQLVDDGVLSLDQEVGRQVADYLGLGGIDPNAGSITLRQLLSHTSGFPQHYSTFFAHQVGTCREAAQVGLSSGVSGGRGFRYSNMNYCVLGLLIEAVTGKAYERVVQERLLTPLGIVGMRFTATFEIAPDEVSNFPTAGRNYMEALGAAGQWNATPGDLVTIINSVDPKTPGWKALTPAGLAAMRNRVPHDGPPSGYGLGVINYPGSAWGHTGTIEHAHSMVLVQPDGVTWAVTVAGDTPSKTGQLRTIIGQAFAAAFPK